MVSRWESRAKISGMPAWTEEHFTADPRAATPEPIALELSSGRALGVPVDVYGVVGPADRSTLASLREELNEAERARAERYLDPRVGETFVLSRGWLRRLLGERLGVRAHEVPLSFGEHGRPELADTTLSFNVTHSGPVVLYAFAYNVSLGIDVERVRTNLAYNEIAQRYFSERERATLGELPASEQPLAFFRGWTRKEAYLKAKGAGLTFPLTRFDVSLDDAPRLQRTEIAEDHAEQWELHEFAPCPGFIGCAIVGPPAR